MPVADVVLAVSRRPLAGVDPLRFLGDAAQEIARASAVRGAVLVVPATGWARGSDGTATLIGEIQQRDGQGPVATAARTLRPMLTPDLTRIGPPALAAVADEAGLTSSVAVALTVDGGVVAVLQLVGLAERPVGQADVDALGPACEVLAARIVDLIELARLRQAGPGALPPTPPPLPIPAQAPAPPAEASPATRTEALPAVTPRTEVQPVVRVEPARVDVVPVQAARPDVVRVAAPDPVRPVRVDRPKPARPEPVAVEVPEFDPVPLASAAPELVTEELRAVDGTVVHLAAAKPRARHRQA